MLKKNPNHFREIGKLGGQRGTTGGFASSKVGADGLTGKQRAALAGAKGGKISRRTKTVIVHEGEHHTIPEATKKMGISVSTLFRKIKSGHVKTTKK